VVNKSSPGLQGYLFFQGQKMVFKIKEKISFYDKGKVDSGGTASLFLNLCITWN
jgi:hypothetical protein